MMREGRKVGKKGEKETKREGDRKKRGGGWGEKGEREKGGRI